MSQSGQGGLSRVRQIEEKIAELKSRWPKHSVKVAMWQELEALEDELEKAQREEAGGAKDGSR
jgi:hypothetical protein